MSKPHLYNYYAQINASTCQCFAIRRTTDLLNDPTLIQIPVYDTKYIGKYFLKGAWYHILEP